MYIGPKSRTQRPRKTKIGTEVAHVTRDSDTTFKVKRPKVKVTRPLYSPRRLRIRQLQRWPWERIHRGNQLLRSGAVDSAARGASAPTEGGEGHIVAASAQLVIIYVVDRKTAGTVIVGVFIHTYSRIINSLLCSGWCLNYTVRKCAVPCTGQRKRA